VTRVDVVAVTHRGLVRGRNEDTLAVAGFLSGAFENEPVKLEVNTEQPVSFLVADGLGGHVEGFRASRLVAGLLSDATTEMRDEESIVAAVRGASDAVFTEMAHNPDWYGMGTTVVGLVLDGDRAFCLNVGDSRCYRVHDDGELEQLSIDDSPPLDPSSGRRFTTIVTQTLGGTRQESTIHPHVSVHRVVPGDRFLLCSDGLTDYSEPEALPAALADPNADPIDTANALLHAAFEGGGKDNVSIVLLKVL
jgi:serine/threonine protein phosphatase PrpC